MQRDHFLIGAVCLSLLAGCGETVRQQGRVYPDGTSESTLDIQVQREETKIALTNTSAIAFGPSTLWVNASFSRPVKGLGIGQTLTLELSDFIDEHGNRFRAGGFFATRRPHDVVLVEIEDAEGVRYGLIVTRGEAP